MANFQGLNQGGHTGYHELRRQAATWPTTAATPPDPASMLRTSRDLYAHGYYAYDFLAVAVAWSIFAIEAALRNKLNANPKTPLRTLVKQATQERLIPSPGWDNERLDAGRRYRNSAVHGGHVVLTPAAARPLLAASHEAIAGLFPDQPTDHNAPNTVD